MKVIPISFIVSIISLSSLGQTVTNVVARAEGEQILINYDLQGNPGESYDIRISCSRDGGKSFSVTPAKVAGAVNRWEAAGTGKIITWDAKKDLGEFEGDLQFKVTALGKGGATVPVASTTSSTSIASGSGSKTTETDKLTFTIDGIFAVPDGFKVVFKIKAKSDLEIGFALNSTAEDQFGNIYAVTAADIEGAGVLSGKTRKFIANAKKDGEIILKISRQSSPTLSGRALRNLTLETTLGTLQLTDIPR